MKPTLLFIFVFLCAVIWSHAASQSESKLRSLLNDHNQRGCICQVNCGSREDENLRRENARMNETIWLLQEEIRRLKGDQGGGDEYPVIWVDNARWRAFWWFKKDSVWPKCKDDVLGDDYGSCDPKATYCFGRLPQQLSEIGAELLAKDSANTIYRWKFDATNPTAHAAWRAFHDHIETPYNLVKDSQVWDPKVVEGSSPKERQDSFMYRTQNGVVSLLLDDDNCDWYSTLSLGHGMCWADFTTSLGDANIFGVDLLNDARQTPSPNNGLILYFKEDE